MAKTKSAEKRIRQSEKRRERNIIVKSQVKTTVKKLLLAVESRNLEKSKASLEKNSVLFYSMCPFANLK